MSVKAMLVAEEEKSLVLFNILNEIRMTGVDKYFNSTMDYHQMCVDVMKQIQVEESQMWRDALEHILGRLELQWSHFTIKMIKE